MRRKLTLAVASAALAIAAVAGPVAARAPESNADVGCLAAGLAVLQDNGGVAFFARNGVPLSLIGGEGTAPLSTVLKLHLSNPELFPWCD
jgi:hypothetical protein